MKSLTATLALAALLLPLSGCQGPDQTFVRAERITHDAIAEEYHDYVHADPNKSDAAKLRVDRLLEQWERDLKAAEAELKGGQ